MKLGLRIFFAVVVLGALMYFFWFKSKDSNSVVSDAVVNEQVDITQNNTAEEGSSMTYDLIPRDEIYNESDPLAVEVLDELKKRYKDYFEKFVAEMNAANVKMIFCWLTTEVGDSETKVQRVGKKYIKELCAANKVDFIDFSDIFTGNKPEEITYMPVDGHLREKGAQIVADAMAKYIEKYSSSRSNKTYADTERPEVFGDFEPNLEEIRDGGKNIPYKIKINSQGLRMDYALQFPKKKQRVMLIGDSGFFFPFLDNDKTGTAKLQKRFPDKEIINGANWAYSIDDYLSLWQERAKYTEADIVLLQSTGDDIADLFFSHRMRYSRHKEAVQPSPVEKKFYSEFEKTAQKTN